MLTQIVNRTPQVTVQFEDIRTQHFPRNEIMNDTILIVISNRYDIIIS